MLIKTFDNGFINTDEQEDFRKVFELEMSDEGYINLTTEKQFNRLEKQYGSI